MKPTLRDSIIQSLIHGFFKKSVEHEAQTVTIHLGEAKSLVEWFEGFEKELREKRRRYLEQANGSESDMWKEIHAQVAYEIGAILGLFDKKVEILGEEEGASPQ